MLLFSQIMYLARRWARMRRITVLGPWVWGGSSQKNFSPPGSPPGPSPLILSTAVFDCRTFQLNKGKHQCFAEGLKKKKNPRKLLSQHRQQARCGSVPTVPAACAHARLPHSPRDSQSASADVYSRAGPPITGHPLHFNIHLVCPALNKDQIKYNFF